MALTYTPSAELGSKLPAFSLPSVDGKIYSDKDFTSAKALVVMFICNHCPYVRAVEDRLIHLARELEPLGVSFIGICSNDPSEYPEDAPNALLQRWTEKNYRFPYLIDADQSIARSFSAVCTPDLFVYDQTAHLAYRGRLDDSWRDENKVKRHELREAVQALLSGNPPASEQNPSMGCSIKWRKT